MGSVRTSAQLEQKIREVAVRKGITRSEVFRQALESYCEQELTLSEKTRFDDIIGVVDVPNDYSSRTRALFGQILDEKTENARKAIG